MDALDKVLEKLSGELPPADEVCELQDLDDVIYTLEDVLGFNVYLLSLDGGSVERLPADQKQLYEAIVYVQGVMSLLTDMAYDGLFSIFYNRSGNEIGHLRNSLQRGDAELSRLFEEAYQLVAAKLDIVAGDDNVVTRHPDVMPDTLVDSETLDQLEGIENRIEDLREETFDRAIAAYQAAR